MGLCKECYMKWSDRALKDLSNYCLWMAMIDLIHCHHEEENCACIKGPKDLGKGAKLMKGARIHDYNCPVHKEVCGLCEFGGIQYVNLRTSAMSNQIFTVCKFCPECGRKL